MSDTELRQEIAFLRSALQRIADMNVSEATIIRAVAQAALDHTQPPEQRLRIHCAQDIIQYAMAARAWLENPLNTGKITPAESMHISNETEFLKNVASRMDWRIRRSTYK